MKNEQRKVSCKKIHNVFGRLYEYLMIEIPIKIANYSNSLILEATSIRQR